MSILPLMNALITGGAGFIGSHLARQLLEEGKRVRIIDSLTPYYDAGTKRRRIAALQRLGLPLEFLQADLLTVDTSPLLRDIDVVFHLAAQPGVRASWGDGFDTYVDLNVRATQRLLEGMKHAGLSRLVYASSSSVYGDAESHPTPESARPAPISPYGVTKLAAEHLVLAYGRAFGFPVVALRYFTVYGPEQRPDMAFHRFIRAALRNEPILIHGDGEQSRDVTFVSDAVAATIAAATANRSIDQVINVGGGSEATINSCVQVLSEIAGRPLDVVHSEAQPGDARHTSAELTKAIDLLAYAPAVSLTDGLKSEWEWLASAGY